MRLFVCLLDPSGRGIAEAARAPYESLPRSRGLAFCWQTSDQAAVLTAWDDPYGDPLVACHGRRTAVGVARLDNRREVQGLVGTAVGVLTDLELVLHAVVGQGSACIPRLLGDFAFVVWDPATRSAVAACDALAVRKLYRTERDSLTAFASHAEALARGDRYDVQFLAEQVAAAEVDPELSVYQGVRTVPAGTMALLENGRLTSRRYWSPEEISPESDQALSEAEATETLRGLLIEAVRSRLGTNGTTWAQLSGGLDSSSVVSTAQWLVEGGALEHGLSGTVTYVDREATPADERAYSDVIVSRWGVRNETIVDPPMWHDERYDPPWLDQPRPNLMFYPREGRLAEIVTGSGGRVLLTGQGPDEYLEGACSSSPTGSLAGGSTRRCARWSGGLRSGGSRSGS